MFGYPRAELIGRSVRILIPARASSGGGRHPGHIRRGERVDHVETIRIAKDGRLLDISLTMSPLRDKSGAIVGVSKIARDITEQKRAAAELAVQQAWFRVTLASIGDAVIATDPDGRMTFINGRRSALTGWTSEARAAVTRRRVSHHQ